MSRKDTAPRSVAFGRLPPSSGFYMRCSEESDLLMTRPYTVCHLLYRHTHTGGRLPPAGLLHPTSSSVLLLQELCLMPVFFFSPSASAPPPSPPRYFTSCSAPSPPVLFFTKPNLHAFTFHSLSLEHLAGVNTYRKTSCSVNGHFYIRNQT